MKTILDRVLESPLVGEVIAVDDASTDATLELLRGYDNDRLRVLAQPVNCGKGAALRCGFAEATMPYVIVQDADLEYDPGEYPRILAPLLADEADVVYGSRFSGGDARRILYFWHTLGNRALTLASNMATNLNLSDMETCYKAFRREIIQSIDIEEDRFGFEPRSPPRSPHCTAACTRWGSATTDAPTTTARRSAGATVCGRSSASRPTPRRESGSACAAPARSSPASPVPDARPRTGRAGTSTIVRVSPHQGGVTMDARAVSRENGSSPIRWRTSCNHNTFTRRGVPKTQSPDRAAGSPSE